MWFCVVLRKITHTKEKVEVTCAPLAHISRVASEGFFCQDAERPPRASPEARVEALAAGRVGGGGHGWGRGGGAGPRSW